MSDRCLTRFDEGEGVGQEVGQVPQRHARLTAGFPVDHPEASTSVNDNVPRPSRYERALRVRAAQLPAPPPMVA